MLIEALDDRFVNTNVMHNLLCCRHRPRSSIFGNVTQEPLLLRVPLFFLGALEISWNLLLVYMAHLVLFSRSERYEILSVSPRFSTSVWKSRLMMKWKYQVDLLLEKMVQDEMSYTIRQMDGFNKSAKTEL